MKPANNIAHSVFQRLLNLSKERREDFNLLLSRYGVERFLYRLGISSYADSFILKGASLFLVWTGQNYRVTRDLDLLGSGKSDEENLVKVFRSIVTLRPDKDDGIVFMADSLKIERIREEEVYEGARITLTGLLCRARIPVQIDIGFGDTITPGPEPVDYPTLLSGDVPKIRAYPRCTLVAEKLEAIVKLGFANSRMKDFYDIWLLARLYEFDGKILGQAIANTFARRETSVPAGIPVAFTPSFFADSQKMVQWNAFIRKSRPEPSPDDFASAVSGVADLLLPVLSAIIGKASFEKTWLPDKGWVP